MPILRYNLKIKVMSNSRKKIKDLKLLPNTALFWGDDAEDVKISTGITQATFDKIMGKKSVNLT